MGTGLSFQEFVELKLKPPAGADRAFFEAAEQERDEMFPMRLVSAANHLRSPGYDCKPATLELLLEDGVVTPAAPDAWTQADVDAVASHLEDCGVLVPYAIACEALGCSYADFLRALRDAAERESLKYGRHVPADDQLFVLHRIPPRGVTGADGNLVEVKSATISFSLMDDVRERLERGKEV